MQRIATSTPAKAASAHFARSKLGGAGAPAPAACAYLQQPQFLSRTYASSVASTSQTPYTGSDDVVHVPLTYWPRTLYQQSQSDHLDQSRDISQPQLSSSSSAPTPATTNEAAYVQLPARVFDSPARPDILHTCVVTHLASLRQGTAANKNRGKVRGSGRKIMQQKGTGKARVGDVKSPIRRGGGRAFPKIPKDWSLGLNRKVWELGVRTALSERWRRGELTVIPSPPEFPSISTREVVAAIREEPFSDTWEKALFLLSDVPKSFELSTRNIPKIDVRPVEELDVYAILQGKRVVLDMEAVQMLADWLGTPEPKRSAANSPYRQVANLMENDQVDFEAVQQDLDRLLLADSAEDGGFEQSGDVASGEIVEETDEEHRGDAEGDAIRQKMEELGEQQGTTVPSEDRPSAKDVL